MKTFLTDKKKTFILPNRVMKRGLTLMETVLALIVGLVVIAGVLVYFNQAQTTNQSIEYEQEITSIVGTVDQLYGAQSNFSGITTQIIAQSGLLPNKYSSDKSTIVSPSKGAVNITPESKNNGSNNAFTITMNSVPNKVCSNLMTTDFGSNMLDHKVNGNDFGTSPAPVNQLQICTNGNDQNTLEWTFN